MKNKLTLICLAAVGLSFATPLLAQDAVTPPAAEAPAKKAPVDKTLLDTVYAGGPLMIPILLCSIGALAVAAYCFLHINSKKMMPPSLVEAVGQYMQARDAGSAYSLCHSQPSVFANTMSAALLKVNFDKDNANKASMEQAAGETLANEETKLNLWVNYLNVFATIGPMLGLLGTVTGMIISFDMLAAGKSEPSDLAGGIGQAMITTAGGLFVGIPAMFVYFYFRNLLAIHMGDVQKRVTFMLDLLSGELKIESASAEYEQAAPEEEIPPAA
jgi:biopolymer transport protein ExbB